MDTPSQRTVAATPPTVLGKAVLLLRAWGIDDHVLTLAELVARTGLHKATSRRLATQLVELGLLDRTDTGYRLSGGLFELGLRASAERSLSEVALPFLQDAYERTRETVHLGVREGADVVYVLKLGGHRQVSAPSRLGGRMPLHCTAIGKVLLAHADPQTRAAVLRGPLERRTPHTVIQPGRLARQLDAVLEQGVAYEREESRLGVTCVAAPVLSSDPADGALGAVSITGPTTRFSPERHVAVVRAAAAGIASTLARRDGRRDDRGDQRGDDGLAAKV